MSQMLKSLQDAVEAFFNDALEDANPLNLSVKGYGGQLRDPDRVAVNLPVLYVDCPSEFQVTADDAGFELLNMSGDPELVLFAKNSAGDDVNRAAIRDVIDWIVDQLQGTTFTINGAPVSVEALGGRILTDYHDEMSAAVLTVNLTSFQD